MANGDESGWKRNANLLLYQMSFSSRQFNGNAKVIKENGENGYWWINGIIVCFEILRTIDLRLRERAEQNKNYYQWVLGH